MSVIQRIRDKGAWFVFGIIALALLAFILQDGSFRRGNFFSNTTVIGKVNGQSIERADFEEKVSMYGGRGANREQTIAQLWNNEVASIIMDQQYKKLGLTVTAKEVSDILFNPMTSPLKREFTDPKTGMFMVDEAKSAFEQLKKSKNTQQMAQVEEAYIKPAIQQALQAKYQALLQQAMYVPKWLVTKTASDNNLISNVSYVYTPYSAIPDSSVKVSDDEILAYASKHKDEYKHDEETRSIAYVTFDANPSATDSMAAFQQVLAKKADLATNTNINTFFAQNTSDLPFYDGFISKNQIKQKSIDSIAKLPVNGVYGPYLDGNEYVIAKLIAVKQLPDSAKVRHILVATHQQDPQSGVLQRVREDSAARKIMDTVEMQLKAGVPFDSVALKYSDDGNKSTGGVYDYFTTGRMVPTFNDFSFEKPVGSKGVITTEYGLHYVEVLGQKGSSPAYKIAYYAKPIIVSNETDAAAVNAAAQFASLSKNKKDFDATAAKMNKPILTAEDIKENDYNIPNLGDSRQLVRWIYDHSVGNVEEEPVRIGNNYVVPIVIADIKPGLPPAAVLRPLIEPIVRNEKKAKILLDTKFKAGADLNVYATATGSSVQKADSVSFSSPFITGIGNDAKFTGASFNKSYLNKVTPPVAGSNGVFALQVDALNSKPSTPEEAQTIQQTLLQSLRMAIYRGMDALRKSAVVKDYRSKFY